MIKAPQLAAFLDDALGPSFAPVLPAIKELRKAGPLDNPGSGRGGTVLEVENVAMILLACLAPMPRSALTTLIGALGHMPASVDNRPRCAVPWRSHQPLACLVAAINDPQSFIRYEYAERKPKLLEKHDMIFTLTPDFDGKQHIVEMLRAIELNGVVGDFATAKIGVSQTGGEQTKASVIIGSYRFGNHVEIASNMEGKGSGFKLGTCPLSLIFALNRLLFNGDATPFSQSRGAIESEIFNIADGLVRQDLPDVDESDAVMQLAMQRIDPAGRIWSIWG